MGVSIPENPVRVQIDNENIDTRYSTEMKYIQKLDGFEGGLISELGGKAFNLNTLISMGVNVPHCFTIKTNAYKVFTQQPKLRNAIENFIEGSESLALEELQSGTGGLRELFFKLPMPGEVVDEITAAYSELTGEEAPGPGVSVRSSATSEDLAEASFAGLHSTYLSASGMEEVLSAVRGCWASLWSAGAVSYRQRCGFDHSSVAMGVVVQRMVPADSSGVMFTSNPVKPNRRELMINSVHGLVEALVSGEAIPDVFTVDKESMDILKRNLSSKAMNAPRIAASVQ